MSTNPHPEGVSEVLKLLRTIETLEADAAQLRPMVQRLADVEKQLNEERARLQPLLRSMDLEAIGNMGWERRMGWFLAEMRRQIIRTQKEGGR